MVVAAATFTVQNVGGAKGGALRRWGEQVADADEDARFGEPPTSFAEVMLPRPLSKWKTQIPSTFDKGRIVRQLPSEVNARTTAADKPAWPRFCSTVKAPSEATQRWVCAEDDGCVAGAEKRSRSACARSAAAPHARGGGDVAGYAEDRTVRAIAGHEGQTRHERQ
mgnify:CR=1 FL=1